MKERDGGNLGAGRASRAVRFLAALYVLEASAALLALCLYKKAGIPLGEFAGRPAGIALIASSILGGAALLFLMREATRQADHPREILHALGANLLSVTIVLASADIGLRLLVSREDPAWPRIGSTILLPHDWKRVSRARLRLVEEASANGPWSDAFRVYHPVLGWTNGASRTSRDGLSLSSVEGIRSPRAGVSFREMGPARIVAILGDSNAFGLEVPFEDSWGAHLDRALGEGVRVLNFGVDGYGVDQAYLRYLEDVVAWRPEVVIFGFIHHDLERTLSVYPFLTFRWQMPFTKPRFTLGPEGLRNINDRLLDPEELFSVASVDALPLIDRDPGYNAEQWQERSIHKLMLARYLLSRFPRWRARDPALDEEKLDLNAALLRSFVHAVRTNGSVPLVVYFPTAGAGDFSDAEAVPLGGLRAHEVLLKAGVDYQDLTPAVEQVPAVERMVESGRHYAPVTNEVVAGWLAPVVREALSARSQ